MWFDIPVTLVLDRIRLGKCSVSVFQVFNWSYVSYPLQWSTHDSSRDNVLGNISGKWVVLHSTSFQCLMPKVKSPTRHAHIMDRYTQFGNSFSFYNVIWGKKPGHWSNTKISDYITCTYCYCATCYFIYDLQLVQNLQRRNVRRKQEHEGNFHIGWYLLTVIDTHQREVSHYNLKYNVLNTTHTTSICLKEKG